jgi:gamma-glutamyl:cysteine ligase YbdK (ATP-grasp superfamily)
MQALLIDIDTGAREPAGAQLKRTLALCHRHARELQCERELDALRRLVTRGGAARQLAHGVGGDLREVVAGLARAYSPRRAMNALLDNGLRDEPAAV